MCISLLAYQFPVSVQLHFVDLLPGRVDVSGEPAPDGVGVVLVLLGQVPLGDGLQFGGPLSYVDIGDEDAHGAEPGEDVHVNVVLPYLPVPAGRDDVDLGAIALDVG